MSREKPNSFVAERLRLSPDDDIVVRSRRYLANGRPVETAVSFIPAAFAEGTRIEQVDTGPGASTPDWKRMATYSVTSPRRSQPECPLPKNGGNWNSNQAFPY